MVFLIEISGYIGEFEYVDDHRAGKIVVELNGRLNKCGVISPRYNVGVSELEDWTARLLPSRQVSCGSWLSYFADCHCPHYSAHSLFRVDHIGELPRCLLSVLLVVYR
jgi:hypothetical protein